MTPQLIPYDFLETLDLQDLARAESNDSGLLICTRTGSHENPEGFIYPMLSVTHESGEKIRAAILKIPGWEKWFGWSWATDHNFPLPLIQRGKCWAIGLETSTGQLFIEAPAKLPKAESEVGLNYIVDEFLRGKLGESDAVLGMPSLEWAKGQVKAGDKAIGWRKPASMLIADPDTGKLLSNKPMTATQISVATGAPLADVLEMVNGFLAEQAA